ncbi:hypothetical protein ACIXFX_25125, partial [Bacteroides fragilis]
LTTFRGMCIEAIHYYVTVSYYDSCNDFRNVKIKRPITQKEIEMSKITISEKVQQFISERTDKAGGYYEYIDVIAQKHALEAAEMVKQETKEKCQIAFRNFMLRATLANVSGESLDFEKEFADTMSQI